MIRERIHAASKKFLVQGGDARVFGADVDARWQLDEDQVETRFREAWSKQLASALEKAATITAEEARELVGDKRTRYVTEGYEFRRFAVGFAEFVARLARREAELECDQLWSISTQRDPTRLCVHFESPDELRRFAEIAKDLNKQPRDLLLALALDFMHKFP
jgi:hypothetical protein